MKTFIVLSVAVVIFFGCGNDTPKAPESRPQAAQAEHTLPSFDSKKAFSYLTTQTDFGPRNPGSTGHLNCLNYLQSEMQKYADEVNTQAFTMTGYNNEILKLTNVISSFNIQSKNRILLVAHWDTRPRADQEKDVKKQSLPILGANDAASGVAVLMEIGRNLKKVPPGVGVDIVFVDGEDYGKESDNQFYFLGARYLVKNYPVKNLPVFGILLDMIGDKQLEIMKEPYSIEYAPDVVDLVWSTARNLGYSQFSSETQGRVLDDHIPLNQAGIRTIDLIDFKYPDETNKYWHTTEDTPDKCSPESLEAVGTVLLNVIYHYQQ